MQFTATLKTVTYEEERYEFFLQKKHEAERKLEYHTKRLKKAHGHKAIRLHEICSDLGWEINFYDDAMKAFDVYKEASHK